MQGDDCQLQGDLACENAEIRGQLKVAGNAIGPSTPTSGGQAGLTGAGTALDPLVPVAGPFRPIDHVFAFDDYLQSYPPFQVGFNGSTNLQGVGNTSGLQNDFAGTTTVMSINGAAGPLGPGVGSMMGVLDLQLNGANNGRFLSATQFRDGADGGTNINLNLLSDAFDLWFAARCSYESPNAQGNETQMKSFIGFCSRFDSPQIGAPDGAWFHAKDNGVQVNWFLKITLGAVNTDTDTGVRVGFTAAHPADARAAQNLLVRIQGPKAAATLNAYIEGVLVVGPIALGDVTGNRISPLVSLVSLAAAQFQTLYTDWMMWSLTGRNV